jgi:hypothetical protein
MTHTRVMSLSGATLVLAALAACSSGSPTAATGGIGTAQISTDVANATAPDAAGDAADFNANAGYGATAYDIVAVMSRPMMASAGACGPSTGVSVQYVFGAQHQDTINFMRTHEWFGHGACQTAYDSATTDSIAFVGTWNEALHDRDGDWSRQASRVRHSTVFGDPTLHAATSHVWNANAVVHDTVHVVGPVNTRSYAGIAYDTASNVTFNHPRGGEVYPESGTWTRWGTWTLNVTGAKTETKTVQRHIVITFAGGGNDATLKVYDVQRGALALTCTVDLLAHRIVPGSCR